MKTLARQLTGVGRSAIAVIEVTGNEAADAIGHHFQQATPSSMQPGQIRYGKWQSTQSQESTGESIVVTPITQTRYEIHCHGGPAAIRTILADLNVAQFAELPAAPATQTDSESRATLTKPLLIREAEATLIHCTTARTAAITLDQVRGALHTWATESLQRISSLPSGEVEPKRGRRQSTTETIRQQAADILAHAPFTTHLTRPFNVVLLGAPNVGKSSLTNAILGYNRSITTPTPGTTRDILHAETVIDGIPIRLSDTAGIRDTGDAIEQEGTRRATQELQTADLIIRVRDPQTAHVGVEAFPDDPKSNPTPILNVTNKSDLLNLAAAKALAAHPPISSPTSAKASTSTFSASATTGQGIPDLLSAIIDHLTLHSPPPGSPAALNDRQANLLRAIVSAVNESDLRKRLAELLAPPMCR